MSLLEWLKSNYPNLAVFLCDDFLKDCLSCAEKLLATNPSDEAIFNCLDEPCCNKRFKNMVLRVFLNIEPEENPIPKMELDILEESICFLFEKFSDKRLLNHLAKKLRNPSQMWQGMHEIYVAGRLCSISSNIKFEVSNPDRPQNKFDILANIEGYNINIEITTRQDDFPRIDGNTHIRATVSPAFCDNSGLEYPKNEISYDKIPESEDLRRKLMDKATKQLPRNGINIIAFGYKAIDNKEWDIANALYGDPQYRLIKGGHWHLKVERVQNGLFYERGFAHISAVVYVRPYSGHGKIYPHPNASKKLPLLVQQRLEQAFVLKANSEYRSDDQWHEVRKRKI